MSEDRIEKAPRRRKQVAPAKPIVLPHEPHMAAAQVELLRSRLEGTSVFLEYGAGGSTYMAAASGVATIVSVESDKTFARAIHDHVAAAFPETSLTMLIPSIGPTGIWGRPLDKSGVKGWPRYVLNPWSRLATMELQPDLVLVDGRFRVACFLASVMLGKVGSHILFDDYLGREKAYGLAEKYAKKIKVVEKMAIFEVEDLEKAVLKSLAVDLAKNCVQYA